MLVDRGFLGRTLSTVLVLLSFGQSSVDALDTGDSRFNGVAGDLPLAMRDWWMPDAEFFALLWKDQLEAVAIESGEYFARTADRAAALDEYDQKGRSWCPAAMSFPASSALTVANSG